MVSQYSSLLAPLAVDSTLKIIDPKTATNVDLNDIRVVKKIGGTIGNTGLVDGIVFTQVTLFIFFATTKMFVGRRKGCGRTYSR